MFLPVVGAIFAMLIACALSQGGSSDSTVNNITNNMNEVGFYEQAQNIAKAALVIMASVQTVMNSRVANANALGNEKEIKSFVNKNEFSYEIKNIYAWPYRT